MSSLGLGLAIPLLGKGSSVKTLKLIFSGAGTTEVNGEYKLGIGPLPNIWYNVNLAFQLILFENRIYVQSFGDFQNYYRTSIDGGNFTDPYETLVGADPAPVATWQ